MPIARNSRHSAVLSGPEGAISPDGEHGPEAKVVTKVADLITFATNDDAAREGGVVVV